MEDEPVIGGGQRRVVFSAIIMAIIAATTLWYILAGRPGMEGPEASNQPTAEVSPTSEMAAVPVGEGEGVIPVPGDQDTRIIPIPVPVDGQAAAPGELTDVSPTSQTGFGTTALALAAALIMAGGYGFQKGRHASI